MNCIQLEFDIEKSESEKIKESINENFIRIENIRKGIFKKHSLLSKDITSIQEEIFSLKQQLIIIEKFLFTLPNGYQ